MKVELRHFGVSGTRLITAEHGATRPVQPYFSATEAPWEDLDEGALS